MKILVVNTVEFHLNGISSVIMNYFRHIEKDDLQFDFLITNDILKDYKEELAREGCRIFRLARKKNPLTYMIDLYRLIKKEKYDVIHVHGNSATMVFELFPAWLCHVPVRIAHGHSSSCEHQCLHKLMYPLFRFCYTEAAACGEKAGRWLFGDSAYRIINNGIDLDRFLYREKVRKVTREKLGIDDADILIGHIGNFVELKNHRFLLDVFSALKQQKGQCRLLLMSDGPLMEEIKEKVRQMGLEESVIFTGKTTNVDRYYQAMDLFVLPSIYEGLPLVLVEAQAAGLPCIVSNRVSEEADLTGTLEFLPIDDYTLWSEKISDIINMKCSDRRERSEKNQLAITTAGYSINKNADQLKKLYKKQR